MRKIFSSQRLETVEGVAELLRRHGIEVRISNPRSYKGGRRREFSFLDRPHESELSAVWIVQVDQQPRARELLREAGLLATTRPGTGAQAGADGASRGSYFDPRYGGPDHAGRESDGGGAAPRSPRWAWRIRIALLLLIAAAAVFVSLRHRSPPPAPASGAQPAEQDEVRVRLQPATPDAPPPE